MAYGGDSVATADAALVVPVLRVAFATVSGVAEGTRGTAVMVAAAGTGVQTGSGVGLAVAAAAGCPPESNGVMIPEVAGVAVGGNGVGDGDGDGEGDAVPLLAATVGSAVGVTHAEADSVAAPAEPADHPRPMKRIPAVSAAPILTTNRCCLPLCPCIPLPLVPRRSHSLYLAEF